jgi:Tat protein secretion system quality control protein TatD with DNase activity
MMAGIKKLSIEEVARKTKENALKFFKIREDI